ncbi:MAG TPA: ATP-binding protein, partial [Candidatus Dormibacteraeota bacterium]|nr:ATP-binding protein [Candidatus Dormibacteraeota bacterium]
MRSQRAWLDPFVGRADEMERLLLCREGALAGRGRMVVLAGPAGIGKSRLVEEFIIASAGPTCSGHAVERVAAPLRLWRRLLAGMPGGTEMLERELASLRFADDAGGQVDMFDAVCDFLRSAAQPSGLIVILEDLHWADQLSLGLLGHLNAELPASRLLVVATCRPEAATGSLAPL